MQQEKSKTILAIETSCDETSAAVLRYDADAARYQVLAHVTLTQIESHIPYGGVYPSLARREHQLNITHVVSETLAKAGLLIPLSLGESPPFQGRWPEDTRAGGVEQEKLSEILSRETELFPILSDFLSTHGKPAIDAIVVTHGPGLEPALWVGVNTARALSYAWNIPVIPANHMEGHIYSVWAIDQEFSAPNVQFPAVALLISGGHTEFIQLNTWGDYTYLGGTIDDAVGEAFDKAARMMGLDYPGGPKVSKFADQFSATGTKLDPAYELPKPMMHSGDLSMSFSGLKTAVKYMIEKLKVDGNLPPEHIPALCYSFEQSIIAVLVSKTRRAIEQSNAQTLIIGGGVAANNNIISALTKLCNELGVTILTPTRELSTDNALMIALAGIHRTPIENPDELRAVGNLKFN